MRATYYLKNEEREREREKKKIKKLGELKKKKKNFFYLKTRCMLFF